jgi:hypothetical protein
MISLLSADPIIGLQLRLDRTCDRKRACYPDCIGVVTPGAGPHVAGLRLRTTRRLAAPPHHRVAPRRHRARSHQLGNCSEMERFTHREPWRCPAPEP